MGNAYGITLDNASLRWAAAEGVPETVIAAICLLGERSVDEIVARLSPAELQQVINIVGRSAGGYPPGVYAALKDKRDLVSPPQQADRLPLKAALKQQAMLPPKRAANEQARLPCRALPQRRPLVCFSRQVAPWGCSRQQNHQRNPPTA